MRINFLVVYLILFILSGPLLAGQGASELKHSDELKLNPKLQLREVLQQTLARNPKLFTLQSRNAWVKAKKTMAESLLPTSPAITVMHLNDGLASNRGEREWQAELELPLWMQNQRNMRTKVADASLAYATLSRENLKLQLAGELREILWLIAYNENNHALAINKLALAKNLQRDVERRYQAGEMAMTDVMIVEQDSLRFEKEKLRAEAELKHASHRYFLLTGLHEVPANIEEQQSPMQDYSQSSIWAEAQSSLALAETERDLAFIESRENLHLSLNAQSSKGAFDNAANDSVGMKLRIPFGEDARAAPINAAAEMGVGQALSARESLRLELEAAMHEAEHNLEVSRAELALASKQFDIAKKSASLAQKAFQFGESDLVSLLRVQAQTYEAERAYTTRKIQVQWDIARYNQAVGALP
jgi:outer membrane protein TolC